MACVPSEDSDQPGHLPSLIRVFAVRMKKAWVLNNPLSTGKTDQIGRMPRLIWVFTGHTVMLVLSWGSSYVLNTLSHVQKSDSSNGLGINDSLPFKSAKILKKDYVYDSLKTQYLHISHIMRKPVFGVCELVRLKLAWSATKASKSRNIWYSNYRFYTTMSKQQTTNSNYRFYTI